MRDKFVQSLKIHNKRRNARKKFLFAPIWFEGHWIFLHVRKKVFESDRKRALARYTETFYANQATNKMPSWKRIRHSKPAACSKKPYGILNLVRRLEETWSLEDHQSVMEDLAAETSTGSCSAREAERRMGISETSIRRILHGMLDLYLYKIQALHQLL